MAFPKHLEAAFPTRFLISPLPGLGNMMFAQYVERMSAEQEAAAKKMLEDRRNRLLGRGRKVRI